MNTPVVLITGGLTGIGRVAAIAFAKARNRVVASGRQQDAGEALFDELRSLGAEAEFIQTDVRNEDEVRHLGSIGRSNVSGLSTPPLTTAERRASRRADGDPQ